MLTRVEDVIARGRSLSADWQDYLAAGRTFDHAQQSDLVVSLCFSFAIHVEQLVTAAWTLLESPQWPVALPLVRSAYECALRSQWLVAVPDAAEGFVAEDSRSMRAYRDSLSKAESETLREGAELVSHRIVEAQGSFPSSARRFEDMCDDLVPGGTDAYAMFRALSHYAHPSALLAEVHLRRSGDGICPTAQAQGTSEPWAWVAGASLVWATSAASPQDLSRPFRRSLKQYARALGVEPRLAVSDEAWLRNHR